MIPSNTLPAPDTPPAEYLYLDSARVLSDLAQLQGGLSNTVKQNLTTQRSINAGISVGQAANASAASQQQLAVERIFTETESDRFYQLLRLLRAGGAGSSLTTLNASLDTSAGVNQLTRQLRRVGEGDFVRIENAQLFLPPYAAVYPEVRYASYYDTGATKTPEKPLPQLYVPVTKGENKAIKRYIDAIGPNPRLPFEVRGEGTRPLTILIPTRFRGLGTEPSLLSGSLTVVGKLVYKELGDGSYYDRTTFDTFTRALAGAPPQVVKDLGFGRNVVRHLGPGNANLIHRVYGSLYYGAPVAVVLPIAIYQ